MNQISDFVDITAQGSGNRLLDLRCIRALFLYELIPMFNCHGFSFPSAPNKVVQNIILIQLIFSLMMVGA